MSYYVYIVRCSDNSLYTGSTNNIEKRVEQHNLGKGAKAIKGKLPVKLVYRETFETKSQALKREAEIKSWKKVQKEKLINSH